MQDIFPLDNPRNKCYISIKSYKEVRKGGHYVNETFKQTG